MYSLAATATGRGTKSLFQLSALVEAYIQPTADLRATTCSSLHPVAACTSFGPTHYKAHACHKSWTQDQALSPQIFQLLTVICLNRLLRKRSRDCQPLSFFPHPHQHSALVLAHASTATSQQSTPRLDVSGEHTYAAGDPALAQHHFMQRCNCLYGGADSSILVTFMSALITMGSHCMLFVSLACMHCQ